MMTINANTKIAILLKPHPDSLDAIISISSKFEKLRNPLLRKLMAGRTSISMASKIAGCSVTEFFSKLQPLGFTLDKETIPATDKKKSIPDFIRTIKKEKVFELDVRPVIDRKSTRLNSSH